MMAVPAGNLTEMVGAYVAEKTGVQLTPGMYQAFMVVNENSDFVAGVVMANYRDTDVELSVATETPLAWRPHVLRAIFKYIFIQLGCVRCTATTTKANKRARAFNESLGFRLEGNIRLGYDGQRDALVYGLLRSECRYLADDSEGEDGEKEPEGPAGPGPRSDCPSADANEQRQRDCAGEPKPH